MKTQKWSDVRKSVVSKPGAEERIAEHKQEALAEIALHQLRQEQQLSQAALAERLGTSQPNVSQIENAADVRLSTLRDYVEALGGELVVAARFQTGEVHRLAIGGVTLTVGGPDDSWKDAPPVTSRDRGKVTTVGVGSGRVTAKGRTGKISSGATSGRKPTKH